MPYNGISAGKHNTLKSPNPCLLHPDRPHSSRFDRVKSKGEPEEFVWFESPGKCCPCSAQRGAKLVLPLLTQHCGCTWNCTRRQWPGHQETGHSASVPVLALGHRRNCVTACAYFPSGDLSLVSVRAEYFQ